MAVSPKRVRLGEILVGAGVLTEAQLNEALAKQKETREPIGELLTKLGFVTEEKIKYALELQFGVKHVSLKQARIPPEVLKLLPESLLKQYQMVPVTVNQLTVAMVDPNNILAIDQIRHRLKGVNVVPAVCTESDFWETLKAIPKDAPASEAAPAAPPAAPAPGLVAPAPAWAPAPGPAAGAPQTFEGPLLPLSPVTDAEFLGRVEAAAQSPTDVAVTSLAGALFTLGLRRRASEIVLWPGSEGTALKLKVDGAWRAETQLSPRLAGPLSGKLLHLAGVPDGAPDGALGALSLNLDGRAGRATVSAVSTSSGRHVALKLFDAELLAGGAAALERIAGGARAAGLLKAVAARPGGLVLVAGPAGAGKTLVGAALAMEAAKRRGHALTIERGVSVRLHGFTQLAATDAELPARLETGLALRPDLLWLDGFGGHALAGVHAELLSAAGSGALVVAGLAATGPALMSASQAWDVPARPLAQSLAGLVTVRALRALCPSCKQKVMPDERTAAFFKRLNGTGEIYKAVGCESCKKTGFRGLVCALEVLPGLPAVREALASGAPKATLDGLLRQLGGQTLEEHAMSLVASGATTWDEVKRTDIPELSAASAGGSAPGV